MSSLISTTFLLVDLDEKDIDVWRNRNGWFWAHRSELRAAAANPGVRPIPVFGPFSTALKAGINANSRVERAVA